jgi:hypothetical protein
MVFERVFLLVVVKEILTENLKGLMMVYSEAAMMDNYRVFLSAHQMVSRSAVVMVGYLADGMVYMWGNPKVF